MDRSLAIRGTRLPGPSGWGPPVDVLVRDGRIAVIEPASSDGSASASTDGSASASPSWSTAREIDGRRLLAIPGLVNAHTHTHNAFTRASGDDRWLEWHILSQSASSGPWTADDYYAAAAVGAVEMLRSGVVGAIDMVSASGPDWSVKLEAVARAYEDVGLRAILVPAIRDRGFAEALGPVRDLVPADGLVALEALPAQTASVAQHMDRLRSLATWLGSRRGIARPGLAPVNPIQCSDALIRAAIELAGELDLPVQMHCLESRAQAFAGLEADGATTIDRLARLGALGPRTTLVHAVWLTDHDLATIAAAGAAVVHCPASNLKLGSGMAPIRRYVNRGVRVHLGTDGSASGDNQDQFGAMWLAALLSHGMSPDPDDWLTADQVLTMAIGADVAGLRREGDGAGAPGMLAVGAPADLVLLDAASTYLSPRTDVARSLVYAEPGWSVRTVIVDGRVVLDEGRSTGVDVDALAVGLTEAVDRWLAGGGGFGPDLRSILLPLQRAVAARPYLVERQPSVGRLT